MIALPTLRQLQHLLVLAQHQHFGRAALALGITQPSLSSSIRALEDMLGAVLVDRSGKTIQLTPLGHWVATKGGSIIADVTDLANLARVQSAPLSGTLRLGVIPTISPFLLPRLLPTLRERHPHLKLYLREDQTAPLLQQLDQGELDVLLLALPYSCHGTAYPLLEDELLIALRRDHPLAKNSTIALGALQNYPLLTLQDGHCLRDHVLSACQLPKSSDERHAATSLHTLVQMVDNGLGLTLLPHMAIQAGILNGTQLVARPLSPRAHRSIVLYGRKGSARTEEMRLMAEQMRAIL